MKFLILPILFPVLTGLLLYVRPISGNRMRNLSVLTVTLLNSLLIVLLCCKTYPLIRSASAPVLYLIRLFDGFELKLQCDGLSLVFLCLIGFLWPLATCYALEYMETEHNQNRFFAFYTASYGITAGVALSGNLITLYLFYELLTLSTVPLVAHEGDLCAMRATRKYIFYSVGGAALSFVGITVITTFGAAADFRFGGILTADTPYRNRLLVGYLLTFLGFGVKAAIFPFHGWLPSASVAPTPVTALLHAVAVVKSGVFASIRSTFYAFGPGFLTGSWAQTAALVISGFTVLCGSALALREQHFKRRLAYSTVSNLSYILFGMALLTTGGLEAGLSHMLFHGLMKISLFFCAGTVLCKTGREYVFSLEGLGRKMPLTFTFFTVASLALTGAPLLPGFISKMNLLNEAATVSGAPQVFGSAVSGAALFGMIALLLSALLTGAYLLPVCVRAFLLPRDPDLPAPVFTENDRDPGLRMLLPFGILTAVMLLLGLKSGWLMDLLEALL